MAGSTITNSTEVVFCPAFRDIYVGTLDASVPYFVNAFFNAALAVPTTFGNLVVLLAMRHVSSIRLPSKLLLCSLVLTDLATGIFVQPQFALFLFMKGAHPDGTTCPVYFSFYFHASLFSWTSVLTLTVIGLDRYAALFRFLNYQQIVTTRRVCAVLGILWLGSLFFASTVLWNVLLWSRIVTGTLVITFLVTSVAYIKIYRRLRQQQVNTQAQAPEQSTRNSLSMERYRKTASAMMWVYAVFVICFLPYFIMASITAVKRTPLTVCIRDFTYTVLLLNSCLNPFIYCMRLPEVRTEVMKQMRKFCCRSPEV